MLFSSMIFLWIFLPIVLIGYKIIPQKYLKSRNIFLLLASLFFYAWGEPRYIFLLLISIMLNYLFGICIHFFRGSPNLAKGVLIGGILVNAGILLYYKYFAFIFDNFCTLFKAEKSYNYNIILPIGISFYTFQALSYLIDLYHNKVNVQKNPVLLALYISLFPQLVAGPIVKYKDIEQQLRNRPESSMQLAEGIRRFIYGLGKKVIIANSMAQVTDEIYGMPIDNIGWILVCMAAIAYMLQIYYDFSGYSDMAIGLGKMFGFTFLENFNYPYLAKSVSEFWKKWHISMTSWFRDYIYIPLGGNRKGIKRTVFNTCIVFLLTGLWHGANWNFILWGLFNGGFVVLERMGVKKLLEKDKSKMIGHIYTLLVVCFGWILFRIEDIGKAFSYMGMLLTPWKYLYGVTSILEVMNLKTMIIAICGILGTGVIQQFFHRRYKGKYKMEAVRKLKYSTAELALCSLILGYSIVLLISDTYNPFIYYRF